MHYGLFSTDLLRTYKDRYVAPYWYYTVIPRTYNQPIYEKLLDFSEPPYDEIEWYYNAQNGDVLELFLLENRVLVDGVTLDIQIPADIEIQVVTRSNILFDVVDCSSEKRIIVTPFGGYLDRSTDVASHSFVVEEPDYVGLKIISGHQNLAELRINVTALVSDSFDINAKTNSSKHIDAEN